MHYNLTKPCNNCPFRSDKLFYLHPERVEEIAFGDGPFMCHKTVNYPDDDEGQVTDKSEHCAGLLIMLEHMEQPSQIMRIAERLGMYDRHKLDMGAPVYEHVDDYIEQLDNEMVGAG